MWYLNQDHAAFKADPAKRDVAVAEILGRALDTATRYRLELDPAAVAEALGAEAEDEAMTSLIATAGRSGALDLATGSIDEGRRAALTRLLSPTLDGRPDLPLNYVEVVELTDSEGRVTFRATESMQFILFDLPPDAHTALLRALADHGISADAVEAATG